jgi:hypothetical protein
MPLYVMDVLLSTVVFRPNLPVQISRVILMLFAAPSWVTPSASIAEAQTEGADSRPSAARKGMLPLLTVACEMSPKSNATGAVVQLVR